MSYSYKYPRPAVTVDCVVLNDNNVLLIKRLNTPFKDHWALPGGFIDIDETLEEAAYRELSEETGVKNICLKPFKVYDTPGRDPRGRTISQVFIGNMDSPANQNIKADDDAKDIGWFSLNDLPPLAFDHTVIIGDVVNEYIRD